MSVQSHLSSVSGSLVLSASEKTSVQTSVATLSTRLDQHFDSLKDHFRFGSYDRGTILPRSADDRSDVDYMVVFDDATNYQPQTYLDRLRRFVDKRYSTSEVKQSHPTIVLSLNHIHFELVPAVRSGGSVFSTLQIPSPPSGFVRWMSTYPALATQNVLDHNKANSFQTKPLIRLLKYWNCKQYTRPFSSFELEEYVTGLSFYSCYNIKDYFFSAVERLPISYLKPQFAQNNIQKLKTTVAKAKEYELSGLPATAEVEVKKVIPVFP
ncbi:MAG: nucleotidyltransferase domain-containing protein [Phormidesmis sp.]